MGCNTRRFFVLWFPSHSAIGAAALGIKITRFLPAFLLLFLAAGQHLFSRAFGIKRHTTTWRPPLVALGLGLLISNTLGVPRWLDPGLRV